MRTTVNIDDSILKELKRLQKEQGKPLGRLVSDLLALALKRRSESPARDEPLGWIVRDMGARVDLEDRDAVLDAMDDPAAGRAR
jgi:hypothetical protein